MCYAEASYFEGAHFAHIAAWQERKRLQRIDTQQRALREGIKTERTHHGYR